MAGKIRLEDRECPLSSALGHVGEWWTLLILHDAFDGYTRFDQFQANLGVSSSILTSRLKTLTGQGCSNDAATRPGPTATSMSSPTSVAACGPSSSPSPPGATHASTRASAA